MLNDGSGFKKVYLATGFTDLRRGIDGLARNIRFQFQLDPYDKNTLFFCTSGLKTGTSGGPVHRKKHWRSVQTSTGC